MTAQLFTPVELGGVTLPNRIVVSPMCQYSAVDGSAQAWHQVHYGMMAMSGAGLLCFEASHVERDGRITQGCLGLYSDDNEAALKPVIDWARAWMPTWESSATSHASSDWLATCLSPARRPQTMWRWLGSSPARRCCGARAAAPISVPT